MITKLSQTWKTLKKMNKITITIQMKMLEKMDIRLDNKIYSVKVRFH